MKKIFYFLYLVSKMNSSTLKKTLTADINDAIDVALMDTPNITNMIIDYAKHDTFTYWAAEKFFIQFWGHGKIIGFLPKDDNELIERVRELVNVCGWTNENKSIRLDITSWKMKREHIRNMIMSL